MLYNPERGENTATRFDFPIPDYVKAFDVLSSMGIGHATERDCRILSIEGYYPVLSILDGSDVNIDELDYLAKRLDSFWEGEGDQLQAVASAKGITDIEGLINLTFCCDNVTLINDFDNLERAGKMHFINRQGGVVTVSAMEGVDFKQEALDLLNSGQGVVTPYGLLFDNDMEIERLYQGREFPPYLYDQYAAVLWLTHESAPEAKPTCLYLPSPQICLERALERGGWTQGSQDMNIEFEALDAPQELFRHFHPESENPIALNDMAEAISLVQKQDMPTLLAAVELAEPPDAFSLANLALNIDQFEYIPDITNAEEYGRWMIRESGCFLYDAELDEYYDFEGYGESRLAHDIGQFLAGGGYIFIKSDITLEQLMHDQTPSEQPEQGVSFQGM
jgi:hypothetical protein